MHPQLGGPVVQALLQAAKRRAPKGGLRQWHCAAWSTQLERLLRGRRPSVACRRTTGQRLRAVHGIRSALNLRGNNAGKPWYEDEMRASRADGLVHFDYALSAEHDVTPRQMAELLRVVADAPRPLLIHCNAGADRTGLASALYEVSQGVPPVEAARQLSLRFGHVPCLWSKTSAMDRRFAVFVAQRAASAP